MKTIKKIPPVGLSLLALMVLSLGLAITLKLTVKAQDISGNAGWVDADIGAAAQPGGAQADGTGGWLVTSAGADIWHTGDSFHYVYQPLGAGGQLVVRFLGTSSGTNLAKAGLMIRESLDQSARLAMLAMTPSNGLRFIMRDELGADAQRTMLDTNVLAPCWLKIVRNGDWVGGYASADGVNWTIMDWEIIPGLAPQVYIGLAVAAHNAPGKTGLCTAQFEQVSVGPVDLSGAVFPAADNGDGLAGSYFDNRHLYGLPVTSRIDRHLDFNFLDWINWQATNNGGNYSNSCLTVLGIPRNREFGIRWTGEVQAQYTEPYTLAVAHDNGVRVWLNEKLIINDWNAGAQKESSAVVNLVRGQKYLLRAEYFHDYGDAAITLTWSSPSTPKHPIPQSQLYSRPTDTDGNGLPDLWEQHYFGHIGVDPNADPDGDGLSNLQEYQRHSDPANPFNWNLPQPWWHGDIDEDGESKGGADYTNGIFTISSRGGTIFHRQDSFHYAYQPLGTNGQMVARVLGITTANKYAKVGLMVRKTLEGKSPNAMVGLTGDNGLRFSWRDNFRASADHSIGDTNVSAPYWMKIIRYGDWIGGYVSPDGTAWTLLDWETINGMPENVYMGLAVSAHDIGSACTAQFDQVSAGPADMSEVLFPVIGNGDGLAAGYRNDSLLYLPGLTNRVEPQINLYWVHTTQVLRGLNPDAYGARWTGEVQAQFSEPYTFSLSCRQEDWVRVWVNEQLVIDGWRTVHADKDFAGTPVNLVAGQHYLIRVEMFNNHGHGVAKLSWSSPSTPQSPVPQSQLYSQPLDSDGNGLPDLWEQLYFGHTGVDPSADPDGDGLSNLQEYQYHTNPLKADTDGDGIPDAWEIAHGLDPQFAGDAGLNHNNSSYDNLQDYLYGLNPSNPDSNGDGLPDDFELAYLGANATFSITNTVTVAASANGSQAVNYLGNWQVDGSDICALDRRGGLDFNLTVATADKYVLNLIGTQNQQRSIETSFNLWLSIDGQTLGHYTLNAGYGTNGTVEAVLPYVKAGSHVVHVFWDGHASYSNLRIKQVKLLGASGSANQAGIKNWAAQMIADQSGLDNTNTVISSYASPICLEGRDPYPALMWVTNSQTNVLSPVATTDNRWFVNVPLSASTQTVFQASYQNGALRETRWLQWLPVNLLATANNLTIRKGDSLWLTALPTGGVNGNLQVTIGGTNTYTGKAAKGISYKFTTPGVCIVTGTYTSASGSSQSGSITVDVVPQQNLPNVEPAAWTWMPRSLNLPNLTPEAVLQADSRLSCVINGTNPNGAVQLSLGTEANEERSIVARLGTNGPILDSTQVSGFDVWSGGQTSIKIIQVYPDGSQLVEMIIISSPVEPGVTFVLEPIVSGVMFDDGTVIKTLTAANFDALGQCVVRFIRPASAHTSVCHQIKAYQGNYQIGYRH